MKPKLTKTESTFSQNESVRGTNRSYQTKRTGDKVRKIATNLYDIDYAVKWYIQNEIRPLISDDNMQISVPVLFSSGEKWAMAQRNGYLRDKNGMIMTPLIMLKRSSVEERMDLSGNDVLRGAIENTGNRILLEKRYTEQNRYDRFSVYNNIKPKQEFYAIDWPKFVSVNYDVFCWSTHMEQLNEITEQLFMYGGKAWGDAYKFITYVDAPAFESVNDIGSDRLVRCTMGFRTHGHLIPDRMGDSSGTEKYYGTTTQIATETDVPIEPLNETFAERRKRVMGTNAESRIRPRTYQKKS